MRKGLVAVRRVDKNGVLRTLWVRPEAGKAPAFPPAAPSPAPAPAPAPAPRAAPETMREFDDLLTNFNIGDPSIAVDLREMIAGMPEDVADVVVVALWEYDGFGNLPGAQEAVEGVYGPASKVAPAARDTTMRNWGALIPDPDSMPESAAYSVLRHVSIVFEALGGFDGALGSRSFTEVEREAYTAAVRVVCAVSGDPSDPEESLAERGFGRRADEDLFLLDPAGLALFAEHPESLRALEAELIDRDTIATEAVRAVAPAGMLGPGAL